VTKKTSASLSEQTGSTSNPFLHMNTYIIVPFGSVLILELFIHRES
jgi:hypothetical protein